MPLNPQTKPFKPTDGFFRTIKLVEPNQAEKSPFFRKVHTNIILLLLNGRLNVLLYSYL